ncbi:hypothetical protein FOXYSP1_21162 [Fusarium oxysporum f. sp. phaseoli]
MRLAIKLSGRRDVTILAHAIHLGEPQNNSIQLSQAEIEDIRRHNAIILSIFHPGIENEAFFPALFSGKLSDPYSQTCIPKKNFMHWYEEVILPAIQAVINDNNILQYIPKTHTIASSDCSAPREALVALAVAEEEEADMEEELGRFTRAKRQDGPAAQPGSQRKHFYVTLQSRYLAALWEEIHSRAALWPEYAGLRLYMAAKNTKLT